MAFVDGENLNTRFEEMERAGKKPRDYVPQGTMLEVIQRIPGQFVWSPHTISNLYPGDILERVAYYTTYVGPPEQLKDFSATIGRCAHRDPPFSGVSQNSVRGNALDGVYLVTGDVDYSPLIEAVMRAGKRVYVASLSSGTSDVLKELPDRYFNLDVKYFVGIEGARQIEG
jgi:hypothetical protein